MATDPEVTKYDLTAEVEKPKLEVTVEEVRQPAQPTTSNQVEQIGKQISEWLTYLPNYVTNFFGEYQRPLLTVGLILAAFVTLKVSLALLDAINDIPLVKPTFEVIGVGYTLWFVYRYLLSAANRQEILEAIESLKEQVVGKGNRP